MTSVIKKILKKAFPKYSLYCQAFHWLVIDQGSDLHTTGWMKSLGGNKPVDEDGQEVPWMKYPVIKFLQDRFKKDFHLFEFGSGYSTAFYARLVKSVTSVEYNESWFQLVEKSAPGNVELIYKPADVDGEYCRSVNLSGQKYDVVIVDGRDRVNCIRQSIEALSDRGVILLDDSQREKYAEGISYAKGKGFGAIFFEGLKPIENGIGRTTIFYRCNNCLGL